MVSIPLNGAKAGDRRLRRLFRELKNASSLVSRKKGSYLMRQGGKNHGACLLASGQARLSMRSDRGQTVAFHLISAPCVLGLPATLSRRPYNFTAVLSSDAQVACLDRDAVLAILRKHQSLALCVVEILGRGVSEMRAHPKRAPRKTAQKARSAVPVSTALRR